ncbi:2-C-methyl-D-erythritol 4-phosphate cytidylyltransferase [Candidatus Methylacidithermus pantelleriae]|uniref:2-C-methyl-D-erythritol 4-phosphate cytidylyltransferase n=1 Tax=Candidatus Methylacidithermus pantelleriae TaxID=2744239 RepID=UPI001BD48BFC|nr:2-C-methyl-D-erythritol 4-phosphate cytidylyltransferase [Candidatus Methylacidithermus pantelleriae]
MPRNVVDAILVAAGQSRRMGFDKLFTPRKGKTLLEICLRRVLSFSALGRLALVIPAERFSQAAALASRLGIEQKTCIVPGGRRRQDSVYAGLNALSEGSPFVMVHDAARPLVTCELIERVWRVALEVGAAACGLPSRDTVKEAESGQNWVRRTLDRSLLWLIQTPQIFRREILQKAYEALMRDTVEVTDDAAAVERVGYRVQLVPYEGWNFKVTSPPDWELVWSLLERGDG